MIKCRAFTFALFALATSHTFALSAVVADPPSKRVNGDDITNPLTYRLFMDGKEAYANALPYFQVDLSNVAEVCMTAVEHWPDGYQMESGFACFKNDKSFPALPSKIRIELIYDGTN